VALVIGAGTILGVRYENHRRWRAFQQVLARCGTDPACKKTVREEAGRAGIPDYVEPDLGFFFALVLATTGLVLLEVHRNLGNAVAVPGGDPGVRPLDPSGPAPVMGVPSFRFIVSREQPDLHNYLARACARVRGIQVIYDRRVRERRRAAQARLVDRRRGDRRVLVSVDAEIREYGAAIVSADRAPE
jgi:hypothetical protein